LQRLHKKIREKFNSINSGLFKGFKVVTMKFRLNFFLPSLLALAVWPSLIGAQSSRITLPAHLTASRPRIAALAGNSHDDITNLLQKDAAARDQLQRSQKELAPYMEYVQKDPMWVASRLQMYWKTHATDVYNRGDNFDHTEGEAPVATVRYPGSRNPNSVYSAPKLEDIPAYEDDTRGVLLVNGSLPNRPLEWANPAKTGRVIDGINTRIIGMAENAAELYWITGDKRYAEFAHTIFYTYMRGMLYRHEPIDMLHGHSQTIYGMSTFEVIQEGILQSLSNTYDFLYPYIKAEHPQENAEIEQSFKQWIDVTVHNGVPFNNWDLIEAKFISAVATVLADDDAYSDHKGAQYYLNFVLNDDATRQWSLRRILARGFDEKTGIWFESAGYSINVVTDTISLINKLDRHLGTDLLQNLPVTEKAVKALAQYGFPSGVMSCWGDSHYRQISAEAARQMVQNARLHHRPEQERYFTGMVRLLESTSAEKEATTHYKRIDDLFHRDLLELNPEYPALRPEDVRTATFSAPSVSYLAQRSGSDLINGRMISEAGSEGNHQHANGVTIELYGEGLPLAPDSGIGTNYFEADHGEYYSQFPAHNTVVVDGISAYPTMKSHHGFKVNALFPASADPDGVKVPDTFSDVSFLEPETNADQRRVTGIVRTSPEHAYYVDIFRSRRRDGNDRYHDYFFHGLGQDLSITSKDGVTLGKTSTELLTFADEELIGYDYLWNKYVMDASNQYHADYQLRVPGRDAIDLHLWMDGSAAGKRQRQLFSVLAPKANSVGDVLPKQIAQLPVHTLVMRQQGEAWTHPFVSIIDPSDAKHPTAIESVTSLATDGLPAGSVALLVHQKDGSAQTIFNCAESNCAGKINGNEIDAHYAVVNHALSADSIFLGDGRRVATTELSVALNSVGSAWIELRGSLLKFQLTQAGEVTLRGSWKLSKAPVGITAMQKNSGDQHNTILHISSAQPLVELTLSAVAK